MKMVPGGTSVKAMKVMQMTEKWRVEREEQVI